MDDDQRGPKSFEEVAREIADELRRSIERATQVDPEEMVRAAGVDPDEVREWIGSAGEWLRSQLEGAPGERGHRGRPAPSSGGDVFRDAEPHPMDMATQDQGIALAALDSGRWTLEPGTAALTVRGGGPGPKDALGLVRELRERDWIDADGAITLVGRHALTRWLAADQS
jgi:hypothetical protein